MTIKEINKTINQRLEKEEVYFCMIKRPDMNKNLYDVYAGWIMPGKTTLRDLGLNSGNYKKVEQLYIFDNKEEAYRTAVSYSKKFKEQGVCYFKDINTHIRNMETFYKMNKKTKEDLLYKIEGILSYTRFATLLKNGNKIEIPTYPEVIEDEDGFNFFSFTYKEINYFYFLDCDVKSGSYFRLKEELLIMGGNFIKKSEEIERIMKELKNEIRNKETYE